MIPFRFRWEDLRSMIVIRLGCRRLLAGRIVMNRFGRFARVLRAHEIARSGVQLQ
jgi:hypothetical protein